jgi:hypothetical protein
MKKDITLLKRHCKTMGCVENKLMAQQVRETVHKMSKGDRELPSWLGAAAVMQNHNLQKENFGQALGETNKPLFF